MSKEHSSKNGESSAKRNDGCCTSAAMCEENCHHTSGSPVASNAYTLQIPLTLVADWLELPGLPVTRISGKNQGENTSYRLSHFLCLITLFFAFGLGSGILPYIKHPLKRLRLIPVIHPVILNSFRVQKVK